MPKKLTKEEFIEKAINVHHNKFNYSLTEYINSKTKVKIICPTHGVFEQTPNDHLSGKGCSNCNKYTIRYDTKSFIERLKTIKFNQDYDFSKIEYTYNNVPVIIGCPIHGDVDVLPTSLVQGMGCKYCGKNVKLTKEQYIQKAIAVHGEFYDYSKIDYKGYDYPINIVCPLHGEFKQSAGNHIVLKTRCPACAHNTRTKGHIELYEFFKNLGYDVLEEYRPDWLKLYSSRKSYELDLYVPELNLSIEYNGTYWHSEEVLIKRNRPDFHKTKYEKCKENGINLIHIFEFEDLEEWKKSLECYVKNVDRYLITFENVKRVTEIGTAVHTSYGQSFILPR